MCLTQAPVRLSVCFGVRACGNYGNVLAEIPRSRSYPRPRPRPATGLPLSAPVVSIKCSKIMHTKRECN